MCGGLERAQNLLPERHRWGWRADETLITSSHLLCMVQQERVREHYSEQCQHVRHFESLVL